MATIEATDAPTPCRTMSVSQAARILGISRTTAYECVRSGELPALKLGGRIVIPAQVIDELLDQASVVPDALSQSQSNIIASTVAAASREIPGVTCE
jgi:excisionase family DNA binding protein